MRSAPRLGILALTLALAGPARAQKAPDVRYVAPAIAEAYCLPGTGSEVYSTNVLHQGDAIEVVEEVPGGWLKIRPPADSFSWINSRFLNHVTPNQSNWVVAREGVEVPVFIGSMVKNERPKVAGARLTRGAQVRSIGPTQADEEGTWMPIDAPPGEFRYIRAQDVSKSPPTQVAAVAPDPARWLQSTGVPAPAAPPEGTTRGFSPMTPPPPPHPDAETLWRQAQDAQRRGQTAEAVRLYNEAGMACRITNPQLSQEALNRARRLQEGPGPTPTAATAPPPGAPPIPPPPADAETLWRQAQQADVSGRIAEAVRLYTEAGLMAQQTNPELSRSALARAHWLRATHHTDGSPPAYGSPASEVRYPGPSDRSHAERGNEPDPRGNEPPAPPAVRLASPGGTTDRPGTSAYPASRPPNPADLIRRVDDNGTYAAGPGRLRKAGRSVDDNTGYVLENDRGLPIVYVTPQPGLDLERLLGQNVQLTGPAIWSGTLRANWMRATSAQIVP